MHEKRTLRGLTWKHDRGLAPLLATARAFCERYSDVEIGWEVRTLQQFGEASLQGIAEKYDLAVIDHPFVGRIAQDQPFMALDEHFTAAQLKDLQQGSVGQSYASYWFDGHLWALPIDAAAQVAGYRADLLRDSGSRLPQTWLEVFELASCRKGFVTPALSPLDSLMCFFTICANLGEPPFSSRDALVSGETGRQALEYLRVLADNAAEDALSANPIAIWERMSTTDEIAYCPLAFGYSNYARRGYRPKLLSFACIPSSGRGPIGATLGGTGLAISRKCKHPDVALEYANWVAGKDCQRTIYVESGGQPGSRGAWLDEHVNEITNGYFKATLPVLENAWLRPRFGGFESFQVEALKAVHRFLTSGKSDRETLNELNELYSNFALSNRTH
jgi:multiple sugar transport system substrate-binding protein